MKTKPMERTLRGHAAPTASPSARRCPPWRVLLAAGLTLLAACASGPPRTAEQEQSDRELAERVQAALDGDRFLYARHISASVERGVVRLSGYAWSQPDIEEAQRVAELVPGVSRVVDDIELERNSNDNNNVSR